MLGVVHVKWSLDFIRFDAAKKHEFDVLVVAYRDRLTRFGFAYLQELFKAYGADVVAVFQEEPHATVSGFI